MLLLCYLLLGQNPPAFDFEAFQFKHTKDSGKTALRAEKALVGWKPDNSYWSRPPATEIARRALLVGTWKTYSTKLVFQPTAAYENYSVTFTVFNDPYHGQDGFDLIRTATCKDGLITLDRPVGEVGNGFQHLYVISGIHGVSLLPSPQVKDNWSIKDGKLPPRGGWGEGYRLFRYGLDVVYP